MLKQPCDHASIIFRIDTFHALCCWRAPQGGGRDRKCRENGPPVYRILLSLESRRKIFSAWERRGKLQAPDPKSDCQVSLIFDCIVEN